MTASTIDTLIRQAKDGNDDSWIAVIASAHDEIALAIACYATSRAMYDEAIKSTWIACRSTLSQFPASGSARAWLRAVALNNIRQALERELQPGADGLSQALASPALRAVLAVGDGSGEPQADMLRQQILTLSADQQAVLTRRYRDRIELTALAQELSKESHVVAGTLFTARAAADWSKASSSVTDGLFPVLIEDFINGSISVDSRGVLVGCVGKDPNRGLQVARQLRMALLLGAVLHPAEQAEVLSLAQVGMRKRGDTATTGPKTSRVATRRHSSTLRRAASEEDLSENPDGPDPAKGKRLTFALVLVGAMILICVISLAVIWRSPAQSALQQAPAPVAGGATAGSLMAQAGGPRNAIGRIVRHHAGAFVVEAANRIACDDERSLLSGEGLETGADGELQVQYGDHTHVTLGGDTVVSSVSAGAERDPVQIHVQQGNLSVTSSGRQVTVFTATARVELTSGQCTLVATPSATTLDVRHGDVRLSRADGSHGLAMTSDQRASIIDHDGPTLVKSGGFILGINLGGDEVVIHKNQWLSGKMAVLTGLAVAAGTEVAPPIAISAVGLDFDTKAMLGSGLISPAGPVQVSQRAPSGDYDLWLWISGAEGVSSTGVALRLQGHAVEIGAPSERADTWWRLGPYRVTSQSGSIDLAIDGLSRMRLSGLEIDSVDGSSIPAGVALTSPSADSRWYSNQPIRLAVEILGMSDSLSKIQYFDGETMVGESSKAPFAATCTVAPGEHRFSAKTVPRAGAPIESNAVTLRILPAFGEGSIGADMYQGIPGEPVRDLTANAAFPDHPSSHRVLTDFEQRKLGFNYGTRVRGYVSAPIDGAYEFRVSADDTAELWLSTDAQEAGKRRIATCPSHVLFREWGKYPEQHSQPITLVAGQRYYIEALFKQGTADDWLSVGWKLPDGKFEGPIPGIHLSPYSGAEATGVIAAKPAAPGAPPGPGAPAAPVTGNNAPPVPAAEPRFLKGIHLGGDAVVVDGNHWISQHQAESEGLAVKNSRKISVFLEPKPAVDAGMKSMLTTGLASSNGPLTISQHLASGKYLVYVWTMETVRTESRSFMLEINGISMGEIGSLPLDGWSRYGPLDADVVDGLLQITAKPKKGNPQLMGVAIYTPPLSLLADGKGWTVNSPTYHVSINADGCVSNLNIGGVEFLHPVSPLPGGYFMQNGPQKLSFDALSGDNQLVARNANVNVRYTFRPNGATLFLSNTSDKPADWFFLLDQHVSVASDGKSYCKMPVRQPWHDSLWFYGSSKLGFAGASDVWPFEQSTEAMQVILPPMQSRELVLSIGSASADEQQQVATALAQ